MRSSRASRLLWIAMAALLLSFGAMTSIARAGEAAAGDGGWSDWRSWRPSVAIGAGISSRSTNGVVHAQDVDISPGAAQSLQNLYDERSTALDGAVFPIELSLMAPAFESLPADPRLFVSAGYVVNAFKSKVPGAAGFEVVDWTTPGVFPIRIEQTLDQDTIWYVGLGAAFLLPVDRYETRLSASLRYSEDRMTVDRRLLFSTTAARDPNFTITDSTQVLVREIAPGVVLDVDLDQRGPFLIGVYVETHVAIALDSQSESLSVDAPLGGTAKFQFTPDDIRVMGTLGLRLSWVGW